MPSWTQLTEFVPAIMTTAERDADWESPPNRLTIFNSTIGLYQTYAGVRWVSLAQYVNVAASASPGVGDDTDDGYVIGDRWIDTTNDKEYVCVDVTAGAAVWLDLFHAEDHDHDGSPTQKLLAANTHESVATDTHHAQSHTAASHSDQGATGAELETLTDTSDADALHTHPAHAAAGDPHTGYRLDLVRVRRLPAWDRSRPVCRHWHHGRRSPQVRPGVRGHRAIGEVRRDRRAQDCPGAA